MLLRTGTSRMSHEEYDEIMGTIKNYIAEKAVVSASSLTESEEERLSFLETLFSETGFDESLIDKNYYEALRANENLTKLSNKKQGVFPYVFSAIIIIAGILLMVFLSPLYGLLPILAGIIFGVTYAFTYNSRNKKMQAEAESVLCKAKEFFASFGEEFSGSGEAAVRNIKIKLNEMSSLKLKKKNSCDFEANSSIAKSKTFLDEKSKIHLGKDEFDETCESEFIALFKAGEKAKLAEEKREKFDDAVKNADLAYEKLKEATGVYCDFSPEKAYEELSLLVAKMSEEKKNYEQRLKLLKDFIATNGVPEETEEFNLSELEALKAASYEMSEEIKALEKRVAEITAITENIPELTAEISEVSEEVELLKKKASFIEMTEEALKTAKENLAAKYLGPLGEKFSEYKALLSAPENAKLDAELNVGILEGGEKHSSDSYSTGLRDAMAIAVRFALINALFKDEKPVVILDDPFTNLDKDRIGKAKAVIDILAKEYQILYLTCHESRI